MSAAGWRVRFDQAVGSSRREGSGVDTPSARLTVSPAPARPEAAGSSVTRAEWRRDLARELVIAAVAYVGYFLVRGATQGDAAAALRNARAIEDFERSLGIFIEPTLQAAVVGSTWLVDALNGIYLLGHWPVIVAVGIWLYVTRPETYRMYRTAFIISGAIGLFFFMQYPTAPPRLAEFGFIDTVSERAGIFRLLQPKAFTNQYAAFPSLHFGWSLLVGIALAVEGERRWVRLLSVVPPVAMLAAIVLTANHYLIDAIAGAAISLFGLALAMGLRWRESVVDAVRVRLVGRREPVSSQRPTGPATGRPSIARLRSGQREAGTGSLGRDARRSWGHRVR
jgi:hypothetical protein